MKKQNLYLEMDVVQMPWHTEGRWMKRTMCKSSVKQLHLEQRSLFKTQQSEGEKKSKINNRGDLSCSGINI